MPELAVILKHNLVGKMINHGCVFFINVLIVRMLGSNLSGIFFNELYLFNFIAFFASLGLDYAAIRFFGENPEFLYSINRKLGIITAISAFGFFLIFGISSFLSVKWISMPWVGIIFCTGNLLMILFQGVLSARKQFNLQNIILGITNAGFLAFISIIYLAHKPAGVNQLGIWYAFLFLFQGICMMYFSFRNTPFSSNSISLKPMIKHGIWIMCSSLIYFAFLRVDNFFVEQYSLDDSLGSYVQCGKIGQYFLYFTSIISSTILPFIHAERLAVSLKDWQKLMKPYVVFLLAIALGIAISGPWIFPALFGPGFEKMHQLMWIFLPGFFCLGLVTLMNAVYIGNNRVKRILYGDIIGLCLVLLFDSLLVPKYGAEAAALISSISYILVFLYLLAGFKSNFLKTQQ